MDEAMWAVPVAFFIEHQAVIFGILSAIFALIVAFVVYAPASRHGEPLILTRDCGRHNANPVT